ncbi:translin-associated factor X-interacting protein 1 isoform X1 [Antennarius striatus]|uniref:translin-associated factor X-interacting protein 1 isoform X1 n=2 Tax=Antennarius striatus TaxID=241820 RepID=UPI0035B467F4
MSPDRDIKFPCVSSSQKRRFNVTHDHIDLQNDTIQRSEESQEANAGSASVKHTARKLCWNGSSYIYAYPGRKPQLLMHLEGYVNHELQTLNSNEPKFQELKLQVYSDVFGVFIKEFKTYRSILSAIKKEYETTLAYQQDQIKELEPLRCHLRLVTEECDRKIQARWAEEKTEIAALKSEKQQLQKDIKAMREKEKAMQTVVDRLQAELTEQYLLYREECDARKLLIWQLNEERTGLVKKEHTAETEQLALKICRADLIKTQEEVNRMKAKYSDVVPRLNWDTLEQTHKQTLSQLKTLQADFNQLKSEYDILLELNKNNNIQNKSQELINVSVANP